MALRVEILWVMFNFVKFTSLWLDIIAHTKVLIKVLIQWQLHLHILYNRAYWFFTPFLLCYIYPQNKAF